MVDRGCFSDMMNDLTHVDDRVRCFVPLHGMTPLPADFRPNAWSVICGRGKECFNHVGNRRFRILCEINLPKYTASNSKIEKSVIVMSIVAAIREASQEGGFIKYHNKTKRWYEVGDTAAREKVGQQLRELLTRKSPTKLQARRQQRTKQRRTKAHLRKGKGGQTEQSNQTETVEEAAHHCDSSSSSGSISAPSLANTSSSSSYSSISAFSASSNDLPSAWNANADHVAESPTGYGDVTEFCSEKAMARARSYLSEDEMLCAIPPSLVHQSSLDW